nr:MAG TPA: hypothetical protein [Caudoviricetes sp.]
MGDMWLKIVRKLPRTLSDCDKTFPNTYPYT